MKFIILSYVILIFVNRSECKPTHPGPCVAPDCFHGQLMHGDKEEGIDHEKEDTYLRIKDELAAGQEEIKPETPEDLGVGKMEIDIGAQGKEEVEKGPIQPIDGEVMMHGEGAKPHDHDEKETPKKEDVKRGPIQPIDGEFMMHGGENKPHDHADKQSVDQKEEGKKHGPGGEDYWHGAINHGDSELGKQHHHHDEKKQPIKYDFSAEDIKAIEGVGNLLSKIDLDEVLKNNAEEYNTFVGKENNNKAEEGSLWDQLNQVRERYLSFGSQEEETEEKRADRLNPMLAEWESEDLPDSGKRENEDNIVHGLEMLGNTAPLRNVHNSRRDSEEREKHATHDEP